MFNFQKYCFKYSQSEQHVVIHRYEWFRTILIIIYWQKEAEELAKAEQESKMQKFVEKQTVSVGNFFDKKGKQITQHVY
jgi:hypothetical protein